MEELVVNIADVDQGGFRGGPDALLTIGLVTAHDLDAVPSRDVLHRIASRYEVWRVATHTPKTYERTWPIGTATPGVKMVSLMQRIEGITHAQFVRHWTELHAPLAVAHHVGLWNYQQRVVRRSFTPGGRLIDGIAELQFASRDDYEHKMFDNDEGRAVIFDDIPRFMRLDTSRAALMTEWIMRTAQD